MTAVTNVSTVSTSIGSVSTNPIVPVITSITSYTASPGTAASDSSIGTVAWVNPDNAKVSDNVYATASMTSGFPTESYSRYLKLTNFGFSIPTDSSIVGVQVSVECKGASGDILDYVVKLVKGGVVVGDNEARPDVEDNAVWPDMDEAILYPASGSEEDLWGISLSPSDVNASDFGVVISCKNVSSSTRLASVDYVSITVYALAAGITNLT